MSITPMQQLVCALRQNGLVRFVEHFHKLFPTNHMKDLVVDRIGPDRHIEVAGRDVVNFGSDSFLGLDQDPRVQDAIRARRPQVGHPQRRVARLLQRPRQRRGRREAGRLARHRGGADLSVGDARQHGAIPGLVGRNDLLVVDEQAHNSMQEGAKIAQANGTRLDLRPLRSRRPRPAFARPGRTASPSWRIDGVYSMSGELPPLAELNEVALAHGAVLYVDDAHGTGVLGDAGPRHRARRAGQLRQHARRRLAVQGFLLLGGFIGCTEDFKLLLKMRSNTFIFGGPVPPPYLDAICIGLRHPHVGGVRTVLGPAQRNSAAAARG